MENWIEISADGTPVKLAQIPVLEYIAFEETIAELLKNRSRYVATYYALTQYADLLLVMAIVNPASKKLMVFAQKVAQKGEIPSLSVRYPSLTIFERVIAEKYGLTFTNHPWPKPVRGLNGNVDRYPFFIIEGDDLHQVQVGPVHAGIIEPGAFRFQCDGEKILHLEIALGYQHRGVERLMVAAPTNLKRIMTAEAITGDTTIGHALAAVQILEQGERNKVLDNERIIALEMERIAMHIADTGALCMDAAYQIGQVACEALRTLVINAMQAWCGSRFGRTLIRPYGTNYRLTLDDIENLRKTLSGVVKRYEAVVYDVFNSPSMLARLDEVCVVSAEIAETHGAVGMAARSSGVARDSRKHLMHTYAEHSPIIETTCDLAARLKIRGREVSQSLEIIRTSLHDLAALWFEKVPAPMYDKPLEANSLAISAIEGWRGMILHTVAVDFKGELFDYQVFDPSLRNWIFLAQSVRGGEISDFPLSNKSFNLSYSGNDL